MTDKIIQIKDAGDNNLFPITNYNNNINIPSINGVPLIGNKAFDELGLITQNGAQLLWTNPSPIDSFAAQTVSLGVDISKFDAFIIKTGYANVADETLCANLVLNDGTKQVIFGAKDPTQATPYFNYRCVTFSNNAATFTLAAYIGSSSTYNVNHHCIPRHIYGINFGVTHLVSQSSNGKYVPGLITFVSTTDQNASLLINGMLTNSKTQLVFTIKTDRSMEEVTPTITSLKMNPRCAGSYCIGSSWISGGNQVIGTSGYTVTAQKVNNYAFTVCVQRSSAYGGTNNYSAVIEIDELIISFA